MSQSPQRTGLTKDETRRSLASFNWNFAFRSAFVTVCGGTTFIFVAFATSLGLTKERVGYMASVTSFACIIQLLSLILTTRIKNKKRFILSVAVAEPLLMIGAVMVVPFLWAGVRLYSLVIAMFLAAAAVHLTSPLSEDWLATTIPAGVRGRYLGRRFQLMSVAVILSTLAVGETLDVVGEKNTFGLACVLAAGGLFGIAAVLALRGATMPELAVASHVEWRDIPATRRTRGFRRYILAMFVYNLPFFFAVPFYQVLNLQVLSLSGRFISRMLVGYYLMKIVAMPLLGRYVDRKGPRWVLLTFGPAYIAFFGGLALSEPGRAWPVVVAWIVAGAADAAYSIAMIGALYASVPNTRSRPAYFAVYNLFALSVYGVGAVTAVPVLEALRDVQLRVGPIVLHQFQIFFAMCMLLMVPCTFGALFLARGQIGREAGGPPAACDPPDDEQPERERT